METREISKGQKDFDGVKWVMKAICKEESRYALQYLHSIGKHIVGSDGHRLHAYRMNEPLAKGSYKVTTDKKTIVLISLDEKEVIAPDFMACVPKHKQAIRVGIQSDRNGDTSAITLLIRAMNPSMTINVRYLSDVLSDSSWIASHNEAGTQPIVFRNGSKFALVMPIRM